MGYRHLRRLLGGLGPDHFDNVTLFGGDHFQTVDRYALHSLQRGELLNGKLKICSLSFKLLDVLALSKNGVLNANHVCRLAQVSEQQESHSAKC